MSVAVEAPPLTIRPAARGDAEAVADLYVQLWEDELPMLLAGGKEGSRRFLVRHMHAEDCRRLRNNYVGVYEGEVVAVYGVSTKEEPRPPFWRKGVVRDVVECVGLVKVPRLLWPIAQNVVTTSVDEWPGTLYMSNLVIRTEYRKYRFGEQLFRHYVELAMARGCDRIAGQVMDPQTVAFYHHMGKSLPLNVKNDGPLPRGKLARKIGVESVMVWSRLPWP